MSRPKISFFAKQAFLNVHPSEPYVHTGVKPKRGHLQRISSLLRAQVAEHIGARLNPESGYDDDVCIYIKPYWKSGMDFTFAGRPFLEVCDANNLFELLKMHPEVTVIAASDWNYNLCKRLLPDHKVVNIPEHHCNIERIVKPKVDKLVTVGLIGQADAIEYLPEGLEAALAERGMKLYFLNRFFTREDVVEFYNQVDVQIIWRPHKNYAKDILMNPLKLINSSSMGVPTIAYDEPTFQELAGCYIGVKTLEEFLEKLDQLRSSPALYQQYVDACLKRAEDYHIDKIGQRYLDLQ